MTFLAHGTVVGCLGPMANDSSWWLKRNP